MTTSTDTKETTPPTAEEIAAAEEKAALDMATGSLVGQITNGQPLRMADDSYVGIVGAARRFNEGDGTLDAVQAELDRVFGKGKIAAADITTPQPEVEPPTTTTTAKK